MMRVFKIAKNKNKYELKEEYKMAKTHGSSGY